jgi:single-stranded DNA-binding protein
MLTVCATGRLGRDAETRTTQGGAQVTGFSLAVDGYEGGEKITTWLKCAMWGERGAKVAPMLRKGTSVSVVGVGSLSTYTGKDGSERTELAVRVDQWTFAGPDRTPRRPRQAHHRAAGLATMACHFDNRHEACEF